MRDRFRLFAPFASPEADSPRPLLHGKGIWARPRFDGTSELERAIDIAHQTGATHVLYKVAHGARYLEGSAAAAQRVGDAGLIPFGWMWLLLDNPEGEAQVAAQALRDGWQGFVFDTEAPTSDKFPQARRLVDAVQQAGIDLSQLYNCSFPNITHHRDLPYDELNQICQGGLMPMAYGSFFAPGNPTPWEQQARRVIDEWTYGHYEYWTERWGYRPPLYPVLAPYHDEFGGVRMGPQEFRVWLNRLAVHAPTFVSFFTAAVIDDALLPLIQDFPLAPVDEDEMAVPERVWVESVAGAVLYDEPRSDAKRRRALIYGADLEALGRGFSSDGSAWLKVLSPDGRAVWVPERSVTPEDPGPPPKLPSPPAPPPNQLTHVWTEQEVNFRSHPVVRSDTLIGRLYPGARMRVVEEPTGARLKLGAYGHWLNVQVQPDGPEGWIAAWYVVDRAPEEEPAEVTQVRVDSDEGLSVRAAPAVTASRLWRVSDRTVLQVLEDPSNAAKKVGQQDAWIHIETPSLHQGHVAAWLVEDDVPPDEREPANDAVLPFGECAWIFGIHGAGSDETADFRYLFQGTGRRGWVLFTEAIGRNPAGMAPNPFRRQKLWDWSQSGYGVILRLNHGYHTDGTLPVSAHYGDFAATCARYAELYLKHPEVDPSTYTWVISIGNEQNNVREHPGGASNPIEHISPERYARAFNLAYGAIKEVLPNATVVTGAVDPYNTYPWALEGNRQWRPLDYFRTMLEGVDKLDGFALHTYTHGPVVDYVTHRRVFTDPPLNPGTVHEHYYDFLAYRPFAEAIPVRWRDLPIYITESNHWTVNPDGSPPVGWVNQNIGWVRAAYGEINRWNSRPHSQQIHSLLLYRWQGDAWRIRDKGAVQEDFRMALANDYRWRR
ncbi:MAG: SH3 domain-containing protein [Anaerolineae bacterium]